MFQRLPLLLYVLLISGTLMAQNVMDPSDPCYKYNPAALLGSPTNPNIPGPGIISKWVHDPTQNAAGRPNSDTIGSHGFDQSTFKCYFIGRTAFRLRFPVNYNPANKYPAIVFLHGAGEAAGATKTNNIGANRENQDQLYHGAQLFEQRMNQGEWNGFLLFPQLMSNSSQWDNNTFPDINRVLDTLQKYNGLDPDRVITMGLSAGGFGTVVYSYYYPQRIAAVISANPKFIQSIIGPDSIKSFLQIPMYMAFGGTDNEPHPSNVMQFRDSMAMKGGNIYLGYNPTTGHASWYPQWNETDINNRYLISTYWNNAHKAQPLLYFQNNQFCEDSAISAKMGLTEGFYAYEWQSNSGGGFTTIPGATANTYTATQAGSYRARFMRTNTSNWSDWSPNPITISRKKCSADTAFAEHFETTPINPYVTISGNPNVFMNSPYFKGNYDCQNGVFINSTEVFTQDATGRQGGTFMLNNTTSSSSCTYYTGDQVWRTYYPANVTPNTDYTLSFYIGNNSQSLTSNPTTNLTQLVPKINGVALTATPAQTTLTGNLSWKKYSYTWNSGFNSYAEIAITNNTTNGSGNDFVLDEISLVKYAPPVMPAGVNTTLWSKAGTITGDDSSPVKLWTNSDINGNNLQQNTVGREPLFKSNSSDNINFNPVVIYNAATALSNFVPSGFSGTGVHSKMQVYIVAKANSTANNQTLFSEGQGSGTLSITTNSNAGLTMSAGSTSGGNSSVLSTPNSTYVINKPTIWTFSKDNTNNTADGNKQDIRKNGLLIAKSSNTSTFTGNNGILRIGGNPGNFTNNNTGNLNGSIAEIIYLLDSSLNAGNQNKVESYLAVKYGTTLGYKAKPITYRASDSTIIWPASTTYQSDIFGIGTDSSSGLVQKQSNSVNSGSGDGTGQSAKGNLVLSTNTTLQDKRFLMIGNDSASLAQTVIPAGGALAVVVGSTRLNREWKVANTGNVGTVTLSFDTTGLGNQAGGSVSSNYALMIDNDGDGDFSNNTISFFNATGASGKKIIFSGVTLNNGVVFTILTLRISSTLPAVWLGFTAEAVNGNGLLNWKTSDEMNVDRYIVEHSFNGVSFSAIASVTANNNSGVNNYTYTDNGLAAGLHYYRIRRVDKDGNSGYSDTKTLRITTSGANVQVRPNPVVGSTLQLAVSVQQNTKTSIQIMSVEGKMLLQQKATLTTGNNLVNLDVSHVPSGVYLVQVQLNDEVVTKKFVRQH